MWPFSCFVYRLIPMTTFSPNLGQDRWQQILSILDGDAVSSRVY